MGHELVGRVEATASDVTRVSPGDPVVVEPNYSCGHCPLCREGNRNLCLSRTTIGINADGGFAELVRVPARCCWRATAGAAGDAEAITHALELVRPGGRVVLTGLPHEPTSVSFFSVVRREITLTGSMIYQDEFPEAMRLLDSGAVQTAPLITHRFGLDRIGEAFAAHADANSIKVALEL